MVRLERISTCRRKSAWKAVGPFTGWVYWQYTVGNFHEKYLIYDNPWPFASEMPIDSTAYESTYAAACYALDRGLQPDRNL